MVLDWLLYFLLLFKSPEVMIMTELRLKMSMFCQSTLIKSLVLT